MEQHKEDYEPLRKFIEPPHRLGAYMYAAPAKRLILQNKHYNRGGRASPKNNAYTHNSARFRADKIQYAPTAAAHKSAAKSRKELRIISRAAAKYGIIRLSAFSQITFTTTEEAEISRLISAVLNGKPSVEDSEKMRQERTQPDDITQYGEMKEGAPMTTDELNQSAGTAAD